MIETSEQTEGSGGASRSGRLVAAPPEGSSRSREGAHQGRYPQDDRPLARRIGRL